MLVDDAEDADTVVVNTCGFVEAAKKDSVDTLLEAADLKASAGHGGRAQAVVAVGLPGRAVRQGPRRVAARGRRGARLRRLPRHRRPAARDRGGGDPPPAHAVGPPAAAADLAGRPRRLRRSRCRATRTSPRSATSPRSVPVRPRRARAPYAVASTPARWRPLKLASGCDRRCSFCAIPSFRGSFVSRRPSDVLQEAQWLATQGVKELFLVSENSTSYGKDLGDLRLLETLLPELSGIDGIERVRVSYLQPAETRPGLIEAIAVDARRRALLRPVLPARQRHGAAADAPLRRPRELPRPARADPRRWPRWPAYAPTSSSASPARPRTTCRPCATSWSRPGWTSPASSATPTRTAPRPRASPTTSSSTTTRSAPAPSTSPPSSRSSTPSAPRSASASRSSCWSSPSTTTSSRAGRPTRARRSTVRRC